MTQNTAPEKFQKIAIFKPHTLCFQFDFLIKPTLVIICILIVLLPGSD